MMDKRKTHFRWVARVFDLMSTLEETSFCELDYRLASFLVRRSDHSGVVRISHQDIASHLGTVREVVSRLLKQFEKNGLIKTARGHITLIDIQKLANTPNPAHS
ncbi:MAG: winged helix-turn-helix domain-containing protein [Gammaproteobacteria bacterium]|nr:winged helix-turn-helix domain-containing protein [Gammaproteobacteria bacterium]